MFLNKSDRLAIVNFNDEKITYTNLVDNVKYYSNYILELKEKKRFSIIIAENRVEWIYSFYAIWDLGLTPITIDMHSSVDELIYFINDSNPEAIIASNLTINTVKEAIEKTNKEIKVYNLDEINIEKDKLNLVSKDERILNHPESEDIAVMLYTSGTTGSPKGVMLTYNNIVSQFDSINSVIKVDSDDQILAVLPFHHILPLMTTNLFFLYHKKQASVVLVEKLSSKDILSALEKNDVTLLVLVPRVFRLFYKGIKDTIDSKWITRTIFKIAKAINNKAFSKILFKKVHQKFGGKIKAFLAGGAKSDIEIMEFFETLGIPYYEGYGLTETAPLISASVDGFAKKIGTVGKAVTNIEIKTVDGELWVRGPIVMKGYYNKEDKTKEVLTEDNWFKTGDLVDIDNDGYISIVGRKNAMIVLSNGKNVDPENLENKLQNFSKGLIKEVGILGHDDKLKALIVIDKEVAKQEKIVNVHAHIKDSVEFYNASVHNYEKVLEYRITEAELPKTRLGKIRRFMLKDAYIGETKVENNKKVEEPTSFEYNLLKNFIYNLKGEYPEADKDLEIEFGLDSLDQVELLTYIENSFSVKLDENEFKENSTLIKLSKYIASKSNGYIESGSNWSSIIKNGEIKELKDGILMLILKPLIYVLFKLYFRLEIKGREYIKDKPQIFIANHESFVDALAISTLLPNNILKKTYSLAINWYFKNSFMKFFADNSNVILLDIDANIKSTIIEAASALKQGKNLFIFPEGTRTKDGEISEFKKSFAILAKELDVDITCLKINGAYEAYSRYMKYPKPSKISVEYLGTVIPKNKEYEEIVKEAENLYKK